MFRFVFQIQTARSSQLAARLVQALWAVNAGKCRKGCSSKALANDWPLNRRAIGFISRSWSFLSNRLLLNVWLCVGIPHAGKIFEKARMDIGNENDQVS